MASVDILEEQLNELQLRPLYQPLDTSIQQIRLLQIQSCTDSEIHCTLKTSSLTEFCPFRALSYEWGSADPEDSVPSSQVFIDGRKFQTTPNLRLALAHLSQKIWYWIDAVCINQNDFEERGLQVRLMTKIYEEAVGVDAWLGLCEGKAELGMQFLNEVFYDIWTNPDADTVAHWKSIWIKSNMADPAREACWDGLNEILSKSYWTRLWIIQELVVTPCRERIQLLCGPYRVFLAHLIRFLNRIVDIHDRAKMSKRSPPYAPVAKKLKATAGKIIKIGKHGADWRGSADRPRQTITLLPLLVQYNEQNCSDPRDRIYALLGISLPYPNGPGSVNIDYTISVRELFKQVAIYIIRGTKSLNILLECRRRTSMMTDIPSWVPDWKMLDSKNRMIRSLHSASGKAESDAKFSADEDTLSTRGWIVGTIDDILSSNDLIKKPPPEVEALPLIKKHVRNVLNYAKQTIEPNEVNESAIETTAPSLNTIHLLYKTVVYPTYGKRHSRKRVGYSKFPSFCNSLYLPDTSPLPPTALEWATVSGRELFCCCRWDRKLCSIAIADTCHPTLKLEYGRDKTIGRCCHRTKIGDVVAVIKGCGNPLVLRPVGETGLFELVDQIYVHEFMEGEAMTMFYEIDIEII